ncbi:MAG: hypothetical protein F6K36_04255 [Symploca sp. SIO3C6]|uniref:Uncharacterized protein n=1 Tax=Symploca sp. SIO1C4 TaxID=2607765 RepID=A0A6B3NAC9_9CYAN|nr:hypothetical protein [Symploca sp. SIO3C6]NER27034.1 hypothetical protein [Symploca sp. SIO1C4]
MIIGNNFKKLPVKEEALNNGSLPIHAYTVSKTPGRLRFRLTHKHRQPDKIEGIIRALKERLEIYRARANGDTGSITLFYAQEHLNFGDICAILRDLGVMLLDVSDRELVDTRGKSEAAAGIMSIVTDWNQRVARATDSTVDLRFLIPVAFGMLSVRQFIAKGLMLEAIPWYVLAWYAFDSFIKLHYTSDPHSKKTLKDIH